MLKKSIFVDEIKARKGQYLKAKKGLNRKIERGQELKKSISRNSRLSSIKKKSKRGLGSLEEKWSMTRIA